jgi:protein transport protein SEC13
VISLTVNSVAWAPFEHGPILACASSDSKVSVVTFNSTSPIVSTYSSHIFPESSSLYNLLIFRFSSTADGSPEPFITDAHPMGATSVSWAPSVVPGSFTRPTAPGQAGASADKQKKFVTGGCDSKVKVWGYRFVFPSSSQLQLEGVIS